MPDWVGTIEDNTSARVLAGFARLCAELEDERFSRLCLRVGYAHALPVHAAVCELVASQHSHTRQSSTKHNTRQ